MAKNNFHIVDLMEEVSNLDQVIDIHKNDASDFMRHQYEHKKLKVSGYLFEELINQDKAMPANAIKVFHLFLDKFYRSELNEQKIPDSDSYQYLKSLVS